MMEEADLKYIFFTNLFCMKGLALFSKFYVLLLDTKKISKIDEKKILFLIKVQ